MCIPNQVNPGTATQATYDAAGGIPLTLGSNWGTNALGIPDPTSIPGIGPEAAPFPRTSTLFKQNQFHMQGISSNVPTKAAGGGAEFVKSPEISSNYSKMFAILGAGIQLWDFNTKTHAANQAVDSLENAQEADNIKFTNRQALNDLESRSTIDDITKQAASTRAEYKVAKETITGGSTARLLLQDFRKNELDLKEKSIDIDTQKRIAMRDQLQSQYAQREAKAKEIMDSVPTRMELAIGIATTAIAAYSTFGVGMFATGMGMALTSRRQKYNAAEAVTQASQTAQLDYDAKQRAFAEKVEELRRKEEKRKAKALFNKDDDTDTYQYI